MWRISPGLLASSRSCLWLGTTAVLLAPQHKRGASVFPSRGGVWISDMVPASQRRVTRPPGRHQPQRHAVYQPERRPVAPAREEGSACEHLLAGTSSVKPPAYTLSTRAANSTPACPGMAVTATPSHDYSGTLQPSSQPTSAVCVCAPSASTALIDSAKGWTTRPSTRSRQTSGVTTPAGAGWSGHASRRSDCGIIVSCGASFLSRLSSPQDHLPLWMPSVAFPRPAPAPAPPAGRLPKPPDPQQFTRSCTPFSPVHVDNSLAHAPVLARLSLPWSTRAMAMGCPPFAQRPACSEALEPAAVARVRLVVQGHLPALSSVD
jgi:hypothetical protein